MRSVVRVIQLLAISFCAISVTGAATGCGGGGSGGGSSCCKICSTGKACGDSCISKSYECHKGAGCACNQKFVVGADPDVPVVESYAYLGPTGLHYGQGEIAGKLPASPASLEIVVGRTAPLYWENIYLGELVPGPDTDLLNFQTDFHGGVCNAFARQFVSALTQLANTNERALSLKELESMGFPGVQSLTNATKLSELVADRSLMTALAISQEAQEVCASGH